MIINPNAESHLMNNFIGTSLQYFISTDNIQETVTHSIRDIFLGDVEDNLELPKLSAVDKKKFRSRVNFAEAAKQYYRYKKELYMYEQGLSLCGEAEIKRMSDKLLEFETDDRYSVIMDYIATFGLDNDFEDLCYDTLSAKTLQNKITKHYELSLMKDILQSKYEVGDVIPNDTLKDLISSIKDKYSLSSKFKIVDIKVAFDCKITTTKVGGKTVNAIKLLKKL